MNRKIIGLLVFMFLLVQGIPGTALDWANKSYADDFSNGGCVAWVKLRAGQKGITLPGTGLNKYGVLGANNYWYTLSYQKGQEPQAGAIAVWEHAGTSSDRYYNYGHVAYIESVNGNTVTYTEGGQESSSSYGEHTGVKQRTMDKSQIPNFGGLSGFLGYIYLNGTPITDNIPQGNLDSVTSSLGYVRISGWALDKDLVSSKINVHAYIDDTIFFGAGIADLVREDVNKAFDYKVGNYHGFDFLIPTNITGKHKITLYAINIGSDGKVKGEGNQLLGSTTVDVQGDTSAPIISDIKVTDITKSGYTVKCTVTDNVGIEKVEFPSWNMDKHNGGQAKWLKGTITGNTATCRIETSSLLSGAIEGNYMTHIYAYDNAGNSSSKAIEKVYVDSTNPNIYDVNVIEKDSAGYVIEFKATDNQKIDRVQCPTWTLKADETGNSQDDIANDWKNNSTVTAENIQGDTYRYKVKISEHNNEYGEYKTHIYAYDICGNSVCYETLDTVLIEEPSDTPSETPSNNPTQVDANAETTGIKLQTEVKDNKIKFIWNVPDKTAAYGIVYALDEQELDVAEANNGYEVSGLKASGGTMTYDCPTAVYKNQPSGVWFRVVMKNGDEVKHSNAVQITNWSDSNLNETTGGDPSNIPGEKSGDGQGDKQGNNPTDTPSGKDSGTDDNSQNSNNTDSNVTNSEKITLSALTVTKATPSTDKITFTWSGDASATGYEIEYSENADLSNPQKAYWNKHSLKYYRLTDLNENTTYYYRLRAYKGEGAEREYSEWTSVASVQTKPKDVTTESPAKQTYSAPKITLKSVKNNKKKTIVVKWKWNVKADGYQISYAKKKNFSGAKKKNVNAYKDSVTIKNLTKGKTYYVKIRSFVKDDAGDKVYGKWSSVKKVKIKK
ncbi:MAG: fibronectin type III domain-containing protein [Lachnospiraceae bacterium]|nr:fibronectin type III domain-containing protein [Lachnospiraceae bacterium]